MMIIAPCRKNCFPYVLRITAFVAFVVIISSCAYRHYLGMHGSSIKKYPLIHSNAAEDKTCLACHTAGSPVASSKTSHPHFKNCLKCHNDDVPPEAIVRKPQEW